MRLLQTILFLLLCNSFLGHSQDRPTYFVQFKISKVSSEKQAKHIDSKLSNKKGVLTTHTDYVTSTYFCTMIAEADYVKEDFENWFSKLGYEISCFNKGIQGSSEMVSPHELKNCEDFNTSQ